MSATIQRPASVVASLACKRLGSLRLSHPRSVGCLRLSPPTSRHWAWWSKPCTVGIQPLPNRSQRSPKNHGRLQAQDWRPLFSTSSSGLSHNQGCLLSEPEIHRLVTLPTL